MGSRMSLAVVVFLAFGLVGVAQEAPSMEIYGGYSLSHQSDHAHLNGWNGQLAGTITDHFSLVADASGHYLGNDPTALGINNLTQTRIFSYTAGPRAYNRLGRVNLFTQALFGISHIAGHAALPTVPPSSEKQKSNPFTMMMGGGVDFKVSDSIALRLAQIDYRLFRIEGSNSNGVRFGAGINFLIGN
jgi:opacity protein-like surface antigen